jgi:uncharacterized protein (UPF0264 family)
MTTTRMLVSVRTVTEALLAAEGGADFIDLKEPREGALGGLPVATIAGVLRALREHGHTQPVSATIGDLPMSPFEPVMRQVHAVAACGVNYVKVGISKGPGAVELLNALAACGQPVIPVFIADQGLDFAVVAHACTLGFPGLMVDTADKLAGSLFDVIGTRELQRFMAAVRGAGAMAGLAGALRLHHLQVLLELAPDFAGFRSAVCAADRGSELDPLRLRALSEALHTHALAA